jgi:hypothetical protein
MKNTLKTSFSYNIGNEINKDSFVTQLHQWLKINKIFESLLKANV